MFEKTVLPGTLWSIQKQQPKKTVEAWLPDLDLTKEDLSLLLNPKMEIHSTLILASMKVLRKSTNVQGFLNSECIESLNYAIKSGSFLQIVHVQRPQHFVLIEGLEDVTKGLVRVFDSLFVQPVATLKEQIAALLRTPKNMFKIIYPWCPKQLDGVSCGIHAIANTTEIIFNQQSYENHNWNWDHKRMRKHLKECLETGLLKQFPKIKSKIGREAFKESVYDVEVFCICRQPSLTESIYLPTRGYLTWIQCCYKNCAKWYHNQCVKILDKDLENWSKKQFICPTCKTGM